MRQLLKIPTLFLLVLLVLTSSCAKSPLGKAVQTGEVNKVFIDGAMDQVVLLYCVDGRVYTNCTPRISQAQYNTALSAYAKAEFAQKAYADAIILWDRVKNAQNDAKVKTALADVKLQFDNAANILCSFKNMASALKDACATVGK